MTLKRVMLTPVEQQLIKELRSMLPKQMYAVVTLARHLSKPGAVVQMSMNYVCALCGGKLGSSRRTEPTTNALICVRCAEKS